MQYFFASVFLRKKKGEGCMRKKSKMIAIIISVAAMVILVAVDLLSKLWIVSTFDVIDHLMKGYDYMYQLSLSVKPIDLIPGVLRFKLVLNDGAMMGFLDNARWLFMILSTVAIIAILVFMFWKKPQNKVLLVALTLVTAGGIGNMVDRTALGSVVDFIDFYAFPSLWKWTFNFADSCVTIGAGMLALWMILDIVKDYKLKKAQKLSAHAEKAVENGENDGE